MAAKAQVTTPAPTNREMQDFTFLKMTTVRF